MNKVKQLGFALENATHDEQSRMRSNGHSMEDRSHERWQTECMLKFEGKARLHATGKKRSVTQGTYTCWHKLTWAYSGLLAEFQLNICSREQNQMHNSKFDLTFTSISKSLLTLVIYRKCLSCTRMNASHPTSTMQALSSWYT